MSRSSISYCAYYYATPSPYSKMSETEPNYDEIGEKLVGMFQILVDKAVSVLRETYNLPVYDSEYTYFDHTFVIPVPQEIYDNEPVMWYIQDLIRNTFQNYYVGIVKMENEDNYSYETNWCGSRCETYNIGPHIYFKVGLGADRHCRHLPITREYRPWKCNIIDISDEIDEEFNNKNYNLESLQEKYNMPIGVGTYSHVIQTEYI